MSLFVLFIRKPALANFIINTIVFDPLSKEGVCADHRLNFTKNKQNGAIGWDEMWYLSSE
jgi:hypothetical protein